MKPFIPHKLPISNLDWHKLLMLCDNAAAPLYRYDGMLDSMLNPDILLAPLIRKEAELSSRIEGTQSTMSEVLEYESGQNFDEYKNKEIQSLRNYRSSLHIAEEYIKEGRPLSLSLVKELHRILMTNAHWDARSQPGEFRKEQVFIGQKGRGIEKASYIPPEHFLIPEYLENWEQYIVSKQNNKLVKAAIIHAQFEIIHPFVDGNGRIGRMLVPLYLYIAGVLQRPMFYISEYFEKNRDAYYENLADISKNNNWQGWIEFFLTAIEIQAKSNIIKVKEISSLYDKMKDAFKEATHSQYYMAALDCFFKRPIINAHLFAEKTQINHPNTARSVLQKLEEKQLITKVQPGGARKSALYAFPSLLNLANESIPHT